MQIEIYNVGHGACAAIRLPNGRLFMVDCGHNGDPSAYWWPSVHYYGREIDILFAMNLDEDHLSDFEALHREARVRQIFTNHSVDAAALAAMKSGNPMGPGVNAFHRWLSGVTPWLFAPPIDGGDVRFRVYHNLYRAPFVDTNDLSLLLVLHYGAFKILFAGDIEKTGWEALLSRPDVRAELSGGVTVFVASHHGRLNGCCDDVFKYCRPEIFVLSDCEMRHDSQETNDWYSTRAAGIPDLSRPVGFGYGKRFVYTTRSDGHLRIEVQPGGRYLIRPFEIPKFPNASTLLTGGLLGLR